MLKSKSAARPYLRLISHWQCNMQTSADEPSLHRPDSNGLFEVCSQVHASALWRGVCGQLLMPLVNNLYLYHIKLICRIHNSEHSSFFILHLRTFFTLHLNYLLQIYEIKLRNLPFLLKMCVFYIIFIGNAVFLG